METVNKNMIYIWFCILVLYLGAIRPLAYENKLPRSYTVDSPRVTSTTTSSDYSSSKGQNKEYTAQYMRKPIDWQKPSENRPYPNLHTVKNLNIRVNISQNRVYICDGSKTIYTMYCSAGNYGTNPQTHKRVSATPTGTFYIQPERGASFYNASLHEGANYYVSWLNHGEYLFHTVPTVANGQYNVKEANKLGKSTGSHGCIRLSVPDARWMMQNMPTGTKVVIQNWLIIDTV